MDTSQVNGSGTGEAAGDQGPPRSRDRLDVLLRAVEAITGDLTMDTVLQSVVRAARDLTGARFAALGVIAQDGQSLARFVHEGFDDAAVARIGRLPQGKGLLGALLTEEQPIRVDRLSEDVRAVGFPPGHPPMGSFLGVPIRVGGRNFGALYLTDAVAGTFTADDQELVSVLARSAGRAIDNARWFQDSQLQHRWLAASADITQRLLTGDSDPLPTIAATALELADADLVTLGVVTDASTLTVEVALGAGAADLVGRRFAINEVVAGIALENGAPMSFSATALPGHRTSTVSRSLDAGPMLVTAMKGQSDPRGVLTLVRRKDRLAFSEAEVAMAGFFADHAAVAMELAEARAAERRLEVFEDRDRIARDLHDQVISELFALGLSLHSAASTPDVPLDARRLLTWADDVDRTIRRIRTTIFALRQPVDATRDTLRQHLLDLCKALTPALGRTPTLSFSGLVDTTPRALWEDLESVAREALTNAAKHARATHVDVEVDATSDRLRLTVTDDGIGIGTPSRSSGLANMRARAAQHGGTCELGSVRGGGTRMTWTVPLPSAVTSVR